MGGEASPDSVEDFAAELDDEPEDPRKVYLPTAEEIAAACREIQTGWSEREREGRRVFRPSEIETRVVRVSRSE